MKVAAIQHDIRWHDPEATRALVEPQVDEALDAGAEFVVLTEMWATGFSMEPATIGQRMDGPTVTWMRERARTGGAWIAGSVAILEDGRATNRFLAAAPTGELVTYDKRHPFSYAGEHEVYDAGDAVVQFEAGGLRITPFVCYDLRFGDDFWRLGPDTDVFVVVANWPRKRREHWITLLRARAIENQCFVVATNRVGRADGLDYSGDSMIVDPLGNVVATAVDDPAVLVAELTPEAVAEVRDRFPFLKDRR